MDIAKRFDENPLIVPADVPPSAEGLTVECAINPGVYKKDGRVHLLMRVAERPKQREGELSILVADRSLPGMLRFESYRLDDPKLEYGDSRMFTYDGVSYLTTRSHLRHAESDDGIGFEVDVAPTVIGESPLETFGAEDCRVSVLEGAYVVTYTGVSEHGVGVMLKRTLDWRELEDFGMILPPHNKDCAIFEEKIGGLYACLHRPSGVDVGGNFIWCATSPDLFHWGGHRCVARTREGMWDEWRIGAGAAPIPTDEGWLEIYHGADRASRYCLGALLLDREDPSRVIARSKEPIMEPLAEYEKKGFFGNVIFTNGHIADGDEITIYYGASDTSICGARLSISEILSSLKE